MTLENFIADYSGKALVMANNTNNTQLNNGRILTTAEIQNLVGTSWIYFINDGEVWDYYVSSTFVGRLIAPVVDGPTFKWEKYIDFYGTQGSILYCKVTVNNWRSYCSYMLTLTLMFILIQWINL